ncbi:MAG TPA: fibronectin type III domain-containing protein, partial [Verrucomicrobiae bacterium]|nr:fibronectin type III domain-containing protein [Verrucomicrobiae bacterium]
MKKINSLFAVVAVGLLTSSPRLSAQSVTLAWSPSPSPSVAGYIVHYGGTSGSYPSATNIPNQTSASVAGLQPGQNYYFA